MRWQGGRRGGNIDDRRGLGGGAMAGGGIGVMILAAIGYFVFDIDPATTTQLASQFGGAGVSEGRQGSPTDQAGAFVDVIGANIDDVWTSRIQGYQPPTVTLYEQGTNTGCGFGQAAMGPFYCPADRHVYLDLSFWSQLETDLGASSADFARAYVIAHEYGHHIQTLTGLSDQVRAAQQRASGQAEANRYSVALELQADCYAGVWARNAASVSNGEVALEAGDLEAGMQTASAIGDDTLQRRQGGQVQPEGFTHGSSAQRVEWLRRGYESGDPAACDTFQAL
ncbi:MAG: neutral zinc metallopeptidase [Alphaproteobacteria bacterium]|nr:neutral zinc metallopeptidase [Alphaproteobacteria bacterium]MBU2040756.1 neutral zinc metallopeptidase [Alphaproteobacteria bacterium]MBU2125171.1 neutral zinc metallopeptidase [Alphaproteobacteria bacterium]MBU2289622.1 neutral zinc metallopeptidase [Alphaproteobacteria bacterium]MBU2396542.1 neutral zinc metallopeptidase [Alphaproteobacteria bacterium]